MDFRPALPFDRALDDARMARLNAQCALLEQLSLKGMELVEALVAQIRAPVAAPLAAPRFQGDVSLAYARVSRAIRLTVALQSRLLVEMVETHKARSDRPAMTAQVAPETDPQEAVEAAETAERADSREREREAPDEIEALLRLPADEVIDLICRDLGVGPEWVAEATARGLRAETEFDEDDDDPEDFDRPLTLRRPPPPRPPERWPRPS